MTNLEKWENFFKRKKWKYKKITGQFGERLFVKTYHNAMRCHIFISETRLNYSFYKAYVLPKATGNDKLQRGIQTQYCFVKRAGTLHIYHKPRNRHVVNMGLHGPDTFFNQMNMVIKQQRNIIDSKRRFSYENQTKVVISKTARNKMLYILEFFLNQNGFKVNINPLDDSLINSAKVLSCSYPSLKNFPIKGRPLKCITGILRKPNLGFNDICKKIFKHNSKIIRKAITRQDRNPSNWIEVGYILKPFLNRGEMEQVMSYDELQTLDGGYERTDVRGLRRFLRKFNSRQLVHLFTQPYRGYEVNDAARQFNEHSDKIIIPDKVQNWHYLHDEISRQYRKLGQADYNFKIKPTVAKIDGVQVEDEVIVVPKSRYELIDWGTRMNNCIAGYHQSFHQGQTILLGIKEKDQIKYNIEITGGQIRQFMANRNSRADEAVINKYKKVFQEYKLIGG